MIKKIYISIFLLLIFFLVSCINLNNYVPIEKYNSKLSELEEADSIIDNKAIEIIGLKEEVNNLENDLDLSNEEIDKYNNLICNLNELLSNVYYVYESKNDGSSSWGTGFSIEYKESYYLLTAGHIVDSEYGKFVNLGFKANFSNEWIYPKLLVYEVTETIPDYAIFYSDKIKDGLNIDFENDISQFILGTTNNDLNILRENKNTGKVGECGSPVIDLEGEVTGIFIGYITFIEDVTEAIDNLE